MTEIHLPRPQFLQTRAGRLALLAALGVDVFVLPPLLAMGVLPQLAGDVFFALTMVVVILAIGRRRGKTIAVGVAIAALLVQFARFGGDGTAVAIVDAALSAAALGTFAGLVLFDVFRSDPVPDRLIDVVLAYLLVGGTFAFLYEIVNLSFPGAVTIRSRPDLGVDYVYFSITTLTSIGSGETLPTHPLSKSLVMLESLIGQLYVAVLIARFVGLTARQPDA